MNNDMNEDRNNEVRQDNGDLMDNEGAGVTTGGMLAGNLTSGNSASGIMSGMIGGGPASGAAANERVNDEDQENSQLNLDALDTLEGYGDMEKRRTDQGVSQAQSELEAGEMN